MTITVIIPTYKRPEELARCLEALRAQERKADEVIVVARDSDKETLAYLHEAIGRFTALKQVIVSRPGQVAALNAGLDSARGDIIAFTDDDCVPHPDWLKRIEEYFISDRTLGAVGGRDRVYIDGREILRTALRIGIVTWYGRIVGNNHLGAGEAREVDHLKGANMTFRREALEGTHFDERLHGEGAQYRNDLGICLAVKKKGWRIIYDPQILVDHFYAKRFENDKRGNFDLTAVENASYNEALIISGYLTFFHRLSWLAYSLLIGGLFTPGILQCLRIIITGQKQPMARFFASLRGRWKGLKDAAEK